MESLSGLGRIPIVAVSAHVLPGYRERCFPAGMDAYQTKPVNIDKLDRSLVRQASETFARMKDEEEQEVVVNVCV